MPRTHRDFLARLTLRGLVAHYGEAPLDLQAAALKALQAYGIARLIPPPDPDHPEAWPATVSPEFTATLPGDGPDAEPVTAWGDTPPELARNFFKAARATLDARAAATAQG